MFVISHTDRFIMNYNFLNKRIHEGGIVHGEKRTEKRREVIFMPIRVSPGHNQS